MMFLITPRLTGTFTTIIVAEAGERQNNNNKNMEKNVRPLTQDQRKEFIQLLKDAKSRFLETLSDNRWKRQEKARKVARQSLFERIGAADLVNKVGESKQIIKDSEVALGKLGICFDSSGKVYFAGSHEDEYEEEVVEKTSEILEAQKEEVRKTYEKAILNVLSTENVDEAKALVEPLV
jgi:ClpP class serine protease